jgi:hypothetical protein
MFNIRGETFGRYDDGDVINKTNLTFEEVRRSLVQDYNCGAIADASVSETVPNAIEFAGEEGEAVVIALDDESFKRLDMFANQVNAATGYLFIEGDTPAEDRWANGDPLDEEDRKVTFLPLEAE